MQGCVGQTPSVGKIDDGLNESEFESTAAPLLDISQTMQTRGHGVSRLCSDAASKQASKVAGLPDIAQTNAAVVDNVPPQDARTPEVSSHDTPQLVPRLCIKESPLVLAGISAMRPQMCPNALFNQGLLHSVGV